MKVQLPLIEKGPEVNEFDDWLLGLSLFNVSASFQDFHWIWIDRVSRGPSASDFCREKKVKGNVCCLKKTADNLMK